MEKITFLVQGSADDPYEVTIKKDGNNLSALCSCPAGEYGIYCKHRFGILGGSTEFIVSKNKAMVKTVQEWLVGTDVETALQEAAKAEVAAEEANNKLKAAKKMVTRTMLD